MNDTEIRQITDALSRSMDARIRQLVDEKFRERTGVEAKAYNWGTVDPSGRILRAQDTGGASSFCQVSRSSVQTISTGTTDTIVSWNSEDTDNFFMHDSGTNPERVNILADGYYLVVVEIEWGSNATGRRWVTLYRDDGVGGTAQLATSHIAPAITSTTAQQTVGIVSATTGWFFYVGVAQTSGGNLNIQGGSHIQVIKL